MEERSVKQQYKKKEKNEKYSVPPKQDQFKKPDFNEFIALQSTQGFWQASSLSDLQKFFKSQLPTHLSTEVICTLAALIILEQFFADRQ